MSDLTIAVATNGPVPDNQCALKDAVLFAASSDQAFTPEDIVGAAKAFYKFLTNPDDGGAVPQSQVAGSTPTTAQTTPA